MCVLCQFICAQTASSSFEVIYDDDDDDDDADDDAQPSPAKRERTHGTTAARIYAGTQPSEYMQQQCCDVMYKDEWLV